jgi:hypothetical protein
MTVALIDVIGANFRTDEGKDALNRKFMERLNMKARYAPARLAIACSVALREPPKRIEGDPGLRVHPKSFAALAKLSDHQSNRCPA